ncbi:MAG TPA: hypothetical protein ENN79_05980 [Desulfobacteraceae bacterium]|nr:hypothetical protein [Desulfobacteraceae bacterium]
MLNAKNGVSIPQGWAVDAKGRPTTDPVDVSERLSSGTPIPEAVACELQNLAKRLGVTLSFQ